MDDDTNTITWTVAQVINQIGLEGGEKLAFDFQNLFKKSMVKGKFYTSLFTHGYSKANYNLFFCFGIKR